MIDEIAVALGGHKVEFDKSTRCINGKMLSEKHTLPSHTKHFSMQKLQLLFSLCALPGLSSCTTAMAQPTTVEAEAKLAAGDAKIHEIAEASGGKAVSIARDWQPLLFADLPATGDEFTVWARYSGAAILVKAELPSGQKDLQWLWDKPASLEWKRVGRFSREQIGKRLVVIRGRGGGQGPILDAVLFSTDDGFKPQAPAAGAATQNGANTNAAADDAAKNANLNEGAAVALGIKDAPSGAFFEAEAHATANVIEAPGASGGKAVKSDNDWQPLIGVPLPAGEAFKVWVRHKGGPITVKTQTGDRWFWTNPGEWKWTETDVFSREELGQTLRVGRNDGSAKPDSPQIDAVVLSPEKKRDLPANAPNPNLPAQKVAASIDWNQTVGAVPVLAWGINEHEIMTNDGATPEFQKHLGALQSPLIRIHYGGSGDAWTSAQKRDWDIEKIRSGFKKSTGFGNAKIMVNISKWPSWISREGTLTPAQEDQFAAMMGRLVTIFRDDLKQNVAYWEILNELDNSYEKAGKLDDLWRLYNKCAAAMRQADPKAKLGGAAFTWAKGAWIDGFLKNCPDAQFISWHNYGTGDHYEGNAEIFEKVRSNLGGNARGAMERVKKSGRQLETFLTEYNVKYTWDPYERRHQNVVGAIFNALAVKEIAQLGLTGANLWQQRGNAYGTLIDNTDKTFIGYHLYQLGPKFLVGKAHKATSGDEKKLELWPVTRADGKKSLLVIAKADHSLVLPAAQTLLPGFKVAHQLNAQGFVEKLEPKTGEFTVPGYSLTLLAQ